MTIPLLPPLVSEILSGNQTVRVSFWLLLPMQRGDLPCASGSVRHYAGEGGLEVVQFHRLQQQLPAQDCAVRQRAPETKHPAQTLLLRLHSAIIKSWRPAARQCRYSLLLLLDSVSAGSVFRELVVHQPVDERLVHLAIRVHFAVEIQLLTCRVQ